MKLFVWVDPYDISYGGTMCFAVAETVEEARKVASASALYRYGQYASVSPGIELGEPDRVLDIPCAEWYEWSE